ncbi:MAG: phosphate ABC transporter permease PstA [bacterium]|uniref:Phosphate transport system permease protein PstA n=2 Tax=Bacteria candidate phyla TaxID=1783234 RepID=A0A101I156_UNCT6|nr:MAG: Phosphate ABC transporter permease protein [candidate division TA06 bacterium 32_111]KUK87107.1 MAG: Phosphate ABC transporter permease protein [candidate division TA06 bacterium 34_109]MDI6699705.1 phosphate ABC transporter permease PstA [bacterium]HAF06801.1 phosphate ABC transporter permease PtsA [candidate division WOR-3 bacterium]HCP17479.1 phosphate ABC transporter permease PtsA [candidate division WOR-3 bacterium]
MKKLKEFGFEFFIYLTTLITIISLFIFLIPIIKNGYKGIFPNFLFTFPKNGMTEGGIFPAIVGTFYLTILSTLFSFPVGIITAIYISEYGKPKFLVDLIKTSITTLSGVPSIIFGLFGYSFFVVRFSLEVSLISGSLTLAILSLPIIIKSVEESLKSVPVAFKEAAYSLGCSKFETIYKVSLPVAFPNILTSLILSIGRVAGETAPIMFTAATLYSRRLPKSLSSEVMAIPYHIYGLVTEGISPEKQIPIAYKSAFVLLLLVLMVNLSAILIRQNLRRKRRW